MYFPKAITRQGSEHATAVRGAGHSSSDSLISPAYDKLAAQQEELQPMVDMFKAISSAAAGESKHTARNHRSSRSSEAAGSTTEEDQESTDGSGIRSSDIFNIKGMSGTSATDLSYYVSPDGSVDVAHGDKMLQMVGFAHPFNASTILVTQVREPYGRDVGRLSD